MARNAVLILIATLSLLAPARAQMAETYVVPLPQDRARWADAGSKIRDRRHACPDVKSMTLVGQDERGDNFRVECGPVGGAPDPMLTFRLTAGAEVRVEPWK